MIHDFLDDDGPSDTAYDHFECMFIRGGTNITVDSNKFYDCQIYSIFIQDSYSAIDGVTIENNWFWANQDMMGACTSDVSGCPAENAGGGSEETVVMGGNGASEKNILFRYNSFDRADGIGQEGSERARATRARSATS